MKPACPATDILQEKFTQVRKELTAALIERDDEIDVVLTALIANEHALFVGNPGTAKSLLLDSLLAWTGGRKFSILLTKFSVPEEVCGPISLAALKEDRFIRITTGKLPEADYAFIDEIFKASSAILNTLLKILNERTFDAGDGEARKVPLRMCLGASNEWPSPETGKELAALFDRFRVFAVATLDSNAIVPSANRTSPRSAVSSLRSGPMKPVNGTATNGRHPPTPSEPETFDPLAEAEAIRLLVVEVGSRLSKLISTLRSSRREKKVLANVWAGLKQLNLAPGGTP